MIVRIVNLAGVEVRSLSIKGAHCQATTFHGDDWQPCRSKASKDKGGWRLCVPHSRLDDIEVGKPLTA